MSNFTFSEGVYPVAPTPFLTDLSIDEAGMKSCLDFYLNSEVAGITILGSGGELPYLNDAEQLAIASLASDHVQGRKPIIAGINAFSEHQALEKIQLIGNRAQAVMLLFHSYYIVDFESVKSALMRIASSATTPIIYYHFPQVSRLWLSPTQLVELMQIENIIGIKDSSLNNYSARKILSSNACENYFTALSLFMPDLFADGARKTICPLAAISPSLAQQVFTECQSSQVPSNSEAFKSLVQLLSITGNSEKKGDSLWSTLRILSQLPIKTLKYAQSPHAATKEALRIQGVSIKTISRGFDSNALDYSNSNQIRSILHRAGIDT